MRSSSHGGTGATSANTLPSGGAWPTAARSSPTRRTGSRALLAQSERESAGLLRMLACGSDATPQPEGASGAWGKLVAHGIDGGTAHDLSMLLQLSAVAR